jgi:hypothetical protein
MVRVLAHEIAHLVNAEVSGSRKILGDGNRDRHIASWLDEGLAVVVASKVAGRPEMIDRCLESMPKAEQGWDDDRLNRALDALDGPERAAAFALAVRRVLDLMREHDTLAAFYRSLWCQDRNRSTARPARTRASRPHS